MAKSDKRKRRMSFTFFFLFMCLMGSFVGSFAIVMQSQSHDPFFRSLNPVYAFLLGFLPVVFFAFIMIQAVKAAGYKDIPMK